MKRLPSERRKVLENREKENQDNGCWIQMCPNKARTKSTPFAPIHFFTWPAYNHYEHNETEYMLNYFDKKVRKIFSYI